MRLIRTRWPDFGRPALPGGQVRERILTVLPPDRFGNVLNP